MRAAGPKGLIQNRCKRSELGRAVVPKFDCECDDLGIRVGARNIRDLEGLAGVTVLRALAWCALRNELGQPAFGLWRSRWC
jgi:hypothetical protein